MDKRILIALCVWIAATSVTAAVLTALDKSRAKNNKRRIPEKTLFLFAFLGGALSEYITMRLIHHKTLHKRFMLGLPAIFLVQIFAVVYMFTHTVQAAFCPP